MLYFFQPTENSTDILCAVRLNCDLLFRSCAMGGAVVSFFSYLAAIRPSSIRHRHTSRGCLWRTSHMNKIQTKRVEGEGNKEKKSLIWKERCFPEINFSLCQKKTGAAAWTEGARFRRHSVSIVHLYLWSWAWIPVGSGCAAEGMRAWKSSEKPWKTSQAPAFSPLSIRKKALSTQFGPDVLIHSFVKMTIDWACMNICATTKQNENAMSRENVTVNNDILLSFTCIWDPPLHHGCSEKRERDEKRKEKE